MYAQSRLLLTGRVGWSHGLGFVFFGTLSLYALHRVIGLSKVRAFAAQERYELIYAHRRHITAYGLLALAGGVWHFLQMPRFLRWWILPAVVLGAAYVLPFGKKGYRLRDFGAVKVFLIAWVFTWLTVWLPALEAGLTDRFATGFMMAERFAFLFAITVPFDLRDREVDLRTGVRTLPVLLGVRRSLLLAEGALLVAGACALLNAYIGCYPSGVLVGMGLSLLSTAYWVWISPTQTRDYYFTGLLDGTMVLQFLLVWAGWHWG